jgi:xanthine/uracil/vitamin C permease (AzgA family)
MGIVEGKLLILLGGIAAGCFLLYLGYRLYDKGVLEKGRIGASGYGVKLSIRDYGPGVVFAFLGVVLITFCIMRTFSTTTIVSNKTVTTVKASPVDVTKQESGATGVAPASPTQRADLTRTESSTETTMTNATTTATTTTAHRQHH